MIFLKTALFTPFRRILLLFFLQDGLQKSDTKPEFQSLFLIFTFNYQIGPQT